MTKFSEKDFQLYKAVRQIEEIVREESQREKLNELHLEFKKNEIGINPYYCQTEKGVMLSYNTFPKHSSDREDYPFVSNSHYYNLHTPEGRFPMYINYNAFLNDEDGKGWIDFLEGNTRPYEQKFTEATKTLDAIKQRVLKRLGAKEVSENKEGNNTYTLYSVHKVDELVLPAPRQRLKWFYRQYETCHDKWTLMTERYNNENTEVE